MRVELKGINHRRKQLADGSFRTDYWAWRGGPPLTGEYGSPEFIASYMEACATKIAPPTGVLQALLFRFQESAEFQHGIEERTCRDYIKQIKRIEGKPSVIFRSRELTIREGTSIFLEWRDKLAQTSLRQADYAYGTLVANPVLGAQAPIDYDELMRQAAASFITAAAPTKFGTTK